MMTFFNDSILLTPGYASEGHFSQTSYLILSVKRRLFHVKEENLGLDLKDASGSHMSYVK